VVLALLGLEMLGVVEVVVVIPRMLVFLVCFSFLSLILFSLFSFALVANRDCIA
jgi:hypothetical protein